MRMCWGLSVAVVVPTYRRPAELQKCLQAIEGQNSPPDEILVVHRAVGDPETEAVATGWASQPGLTARRTVIVDRPGQVAAMEAGVQAAVGAIIVFLDDDVRIRPDWIERCLQHYRNPRVVGVGGRDAVHDRWSATYTPRARVGQISWFGRVSGNHHRGFGVARPVDVLKGANMSLRREYCVFDHRLQGAGSQIHNDSHLCLQARKRGGVIMYDPNCVADHYPAQRHDEDQRGAPSRGAISSVVHNEVYMMLTYLRWWQKGPFLLYTFLVGHRGSWAVLRWLSGYVSGERISVTDQLVPSYQGKVRGLRTWLTTIRKGA